MARVFVCWCGNGLRARLGLSRVAVGVTSKQKDSARVNYIYETDTTPMR